jgi:hypothetical protein
MMDELESLREIFKDVRQHVAIGVVKQAGLAQDNGSYRVQVSLLPEEREIVCFMSFADVYDVTFPEIKDLVLVAFVDGHPDDAHVIARFPASDQPIPLLARSGHSVKYARPGKKMFVGSDTKIGFARPDKDPIQPLVLGTVLQTFLTNVLNAFLNATQIGQSAMGPVMLDPGVRTQLSQYLNTYLSTASTNILSQIAFTERGTE